MRSEEKYRHVINALKGVKVPVATGNDFAVNLGQLLESISNFVTEVDGMGLSEENFSLALKEGLTTLMAGGGQFSNVVRLNPSAQQVGSMNIKGVFGLEGYFSFPNGRYFDAAPNGNYVFTISETGKSYVFELGGAARFNMNETDILRSGKKAVFNDDAVTNLVRLNVSDLRTSQAAPDGSFEIAVIDQFEKVRSVNEIPTAKIPSTIARTISNVSIGAPYTNWDLVENGVHTFVFNVPGCTAKLPLVASNTKFDVTLINQGSEDFDIISNLGANQIWYNGVLTASKTLQVGKCCRVYNNGSNYTVMFYS